MKAQTSKLLPDTEPVPIGTVLPIPICHWVTAAIKPADTTAVAMRPLYSAFMILLSEPSRTKNVPTTEPTMQTAPISSGYIIICDWASPEKKIAASSIVATMVTA